MLRPFGCWLNKADTEAMVQVLEGKGYSRVSSPWNADVILVNTCAVRRDTELRVLKRLRELGNISARTGARVVVAGCLAAIRPRTILEIVPGAGLLGPDFTSHVLSVVEGRENVLIRGGEGRRALPSYRRGLTYVVPIQTGCLSSCSFCVTKVARATLHSFPPHVIVENVKNAVKRGAKEVYLTGMDVASYGYDLGITLIDLVEAVLEEVEGEYRIRIGMMEPWLAARFYDNLLAVMRDQRVYRYLHLPVQSGDDKVLRLMGRKYSAAMFLEMVRRARHVLGEVSVATDIMVGFPGEGDAEFESTLRLLRLAKPDKTHVARYSIRPFTRAALEKQVPEHVKKMRSKMASETALRVAYERNLRLVGTLQEVLVTGVGRDGTVVGRTRSYKQVVLRENGVSPGEFVKVRVDSATPIDLRGHVVS